MKIETGRLLSKLSLMQGAELRSNTFFRTNREFREIVIFFLKDLAPRTAFSKLDLINDRSQHLKPHFTLILYGRP